MQEKRRTLHLLIGPILFALCALLLPASLFTTAAQRIAIGAVVWMAYWWITGPVDYAVTALLPPAGAMFCPRPTPRLLSESVAKACCPKGPRSFLTTKWQ